MEEVKQAKTSKNLKLFVGILAGILIILAVLLFLLRAGQDKKNQPKVITVSTLEKIINVSELSTFTAVYNGIAVVNNEKKPEQVDYYVSYEARVNAGIDFEKIRITVEDADKVVRVLVPEVYITEINVDISSLEFIFNNKKANGSTITQEAFKACEKDVWEESKNQEAILKLAQQNAKNVITALVNPIIEQFDSNYTLVIE